MNPELLDGTTSESIASSDEDAESILQKPETDFGQIGRFANAIDTDKGECVRVRRCVGGCDGRWEVLLALNVKENIRGGFRCEDASQGCG